MKKIIILIICIFISGCYNYNELNKLSIVSSVSIDKKDDLYKVGAQVMNVSSNETSDSSKIIVYEETGKTINEALRKINNKSSRKLYPGHLSKLVLSEEVSKDGINNVLDLFMRIPEIKDEFTITVSKGIDASDVIKIITLPDQIPADFVKNSISSSDIETSLTYSSKLDEFNSLYLKKGIDPVISVIKVDHFSKEGTTTKNTLDSSPKTYIKLDNIGITYKGKLEKYLNDDETTGYNFVRNRINNMIIPIKYDNKYSSISINYSNTKTRVRKNNNKYIIDLYINSKGFLSEYNSSKKINTNYIEKLTEKKIKYYVDKVINVQKNSKSKFLGFDRDIYLNYPHENNYNYMVRIHSNFKLTNKGEIYEK